MTERLERLVLKVPAWGIALITWTVMAAIAGVIYFGFLR
ncbi:hypothetical protein LCGC14_1022660 [marine sediment metagenome]|uniref:Uncharacterized protein n=1 Tax=marine sediment metagenome TaxID=412755 RepID=A0A0F9R2X1_9ZZZZ